MIPRYLICAVKALFIFIGCIWLVVDAKSQMGLRLKDEVALNVDNQCGDDIQMYWINPDDGKLVPQEPIKNNFETNTNSFKGHRFLVTRNGATTIDKTQDTDTFTMSELDTVVEVRTDENGDLHLNVITAKTKLRTSVQKIVSECQDEYAAQEQQCKGEAAAVPGGEGREGAGSGTCATLDVEECVTRRVAELAEGINREARFHRGLHVAMRDALREYACANASAATPPPARRSHFQGVQVETLFDHQRARVDLLRGLAQAEECRALVDRAAPRLRRATVAGATLQDEDIGRRADQATVDYDWSDELDPVARLARRAYAFADSALGPRRGAPLPRGGQEGFSVIRYRPGGDEYRPHCDSDCEGGLAKDGGRVATMVIYCEVPAAGGATTFDNAALTVVPESAGDATFFSYIGDDGEWDDGLTLHSGCPIKEGEKWIATLWMRQGVSDEAPWSSFDPAGNPAY